MKSQVYDRFGGGLLVLIMLTIAVVASEAQPRFQVYADESATPSTVRYDASIDPAH